MSLDLRQDGDLLEGIDNNDRVFKGTIGEVAGESTPTSANASFTLSGQTTAGQEGTISGTLIRTGETTAEMRGTWIEASLFGTVYGVATVPFTPNPTNNPPITNQPGAVAISPPSTTLNNNGDTVTLTASGGSGQFNWSIGNGSLGEFSSDPGHGAQAVYRRLQAGNNTVTVADATDASKTAQAAISQPGSEPTSAVSLTPTSVTLSSDGAGQQFTATGGSGSYTWSLANDNGSFDPAPGNGNTATYVRSRSGDNTVTVQDSSDNSNSDSTLVSQP